MLANLTEETVRKIKNVNVDKNISMNENDSCPQCGNKILINGGSYLSVNLPLPLKFKVLFFNVTLGANVNLNYCPKCGFLAVKVT